MAINLTKILILVGVALLLFAQTGAESTSDSISDEVLDDCDLSLEDGICLYDGKTVITPPPTIDNLIMFLTFDQRLIIDQSGNNNHGRGTISHGPGYFMSNGYSAHFKGEQKVEVGASETLDKAFGNEFSVSFWVFVHKFGTLTTEECDIITKGDRSNKQFTFTVDVVSRSLKITILTEEGGPITLVSNARLLSQRWTHISIVRGDKMMVLYVNGNLDAVTKVEAGKKLASTSLLVGRMPWQDSSGSGCNLEFYLDELKVWNNAIEEAYVEAESGYSLGGAADPHSLQLGCLNCDFKKAEKS